ncbi:rhamnose/proton symporter RhaT [Puteibacter caeruleilacunae]|nr:rhamnose/proton symporter RhaT [Puteibacter caeruleilacunae]
METNTLTGLIYILMAGSLSGTFAIPFKFNVKWKWENNWAIWSLFALLILPWVAAITTVPHLSTILHESIHVVGMVALFGLIWGVGAILFGKGIHYLGVSLSMPIMLGLINSVGTIMPMLYKDPSSLVSPEGIQLLIATSIIIVGIIIISIAGSQKDRQTQDASKKKSNHFVKGLVICILAGIFGPMINFAFVFGEPMQLSAIQQGATSVYASNVIWCVTLTCGFLINFGYCVYILRKNKSHVLYKNVDWKYWLFASLTGIIWYGSIMFYGMGGNMLGSMGASIGWAVMQSLAIITSNLSGIIAGEWKGSSKQSIVIMSTGMLFLIVGIITIASI